MTVSPPRIAPFSTKPGAPLPRFLAYLRGRGRLESHRSSKRCDSLYPCPPPPKGRAPSPRPSPGGRGGSSREGSLIHMSTLPKYLTQDEIKRLFAAITSPRDRALFGV